MLMILTVMHCIGGSGVKPVVLHIAAYQLDSHTMYSASLATISGDRLQCHITQLFLLEVYVWCQRPNVIVMVFA